MHILLRMQQAQQKPEPLGTKPEEKKRPWTGHRISYLVGAMGSLMGAALAKTVLSKRWKEPISKWAENRRLPAFIIGTIDPTYMEEGPRLFRIIDPKQWRSNIVFWGTLIGGVYITEKISNTLFPEKQEADKLNIPKTQQPAPPSTGITPKSWQQTVERQPTQEILR